MAEVPWSGKHHPVFIGVCWNDEMKKWDVNFSAGNFATEEEAEAYADAFAGYLRKWPPTHFLKNIKASVSDIGTA